VSSPRFFTSLPDGQVKCGLCPRGCILAPGKAGSCRVRVNRNGKPDIPFYGFVTGLAIDPIEKKPLYHFRPGTEILSAGFAGCNLHCPFCQNWHISQSVDVPGSVYSPEKLIAAAKTGQFARQPSNATPQQIAYTYSEPLVHVEFLLDCMAEARKAGIANVLVSNGCVNPEAAAEVLDLCDAANIDLKCFSEKTYAEVLGGDLSTVTNFIRTAFERGVHLEITTLVVPGLNDSKTELDKCRDFIAELQTEESVVPWHLSACHPAYKWDKAATTSQSLIGAVRRAREKLAFVYAGNVAPPPGESNFNDTLCPSCGKTLISRRGYQTDTSGLLLKNENGKPAYFCALCEKRAPVRQALKQFDE
jgi:pyruvate formate lyase activating enzyme